MPNSNLNIPFLSKSSGITLGLALVILAGSVAFTKSNSDKFNELDVRVTVIEKTIERELENPSLKEQLIKLDKEVSLIRAELERNN